jgi:hypothetical protein
MILKHISARVFYNLFMHYLLIKEALDRRNSSSNWLNETSIFSAIFFVICNGGSLRRRKSALTNAFRYSIREGNLKPFGDYFLLTVFTLQSKVIE